MNKNSVPFHPTSSDSPTTRETRSILKQERQKKHQAHSEHKVIKSVHYAKEAYQPFAKSSRPIFSKTTQSKLRTENLLLLQRTRKNFNKSQKSNSKSLATTSGAKDTAIEQYLTPNEKDELVKFRHALSRLETPQPPLDSIGLYQQQVESTLTAYKMSQEEILALWRSLSEEKKVEFQELASKNQVAYREEYELVQKDSEALWTKIHLIEAKGNMQKRIKDQSKKISPYRVYKRETASNVKIEFPNMSNEERSQIVKERWRFISQQDKSIYVALARMEEDQTVHQATMGFYEERIGTAKTLGGAITAESLSTIFDMSLIDAQAKSLVAKQHKNSSKNSVHDSDSNKDASLNQDNSIENKLINSIKNPSKSNEKSCDQLILSSSSGDEAPTNLHKNKSSSNHGSTGSNTAEAVNSSDDHATLSYAETAASPMHEIDYQSPDINYNYQGEHTASLTDLKKKLTAQTLQVFDYVPSDDMTKVQRGESD